MFPTRYFPDRYYAPRYFVKIGETVSLSYGPLCFEAVLCCTLGFEACKLMPVTVFQDCEVSQPAAFEAVRVVYYGQ